ncbi:hypothetical protein PTE30175_05210 [Pandoraea terrae]|uniref:Uncharacterized protein n=1 Tax=Pandoraea terrae TaxID=1537710 RepID=A0A5E4ZDJ8_9BURK|nr:hypothetical protein [Pandoraea terrae]VVE58263.1 hypothetical protein PTE30175_05210 [Pandoraea terrae]
MSIAKSLIFLYFLCTGYRSWVMHPAFTRQGSQVQSLYHPPDKWQAIPIDAHETPAPQGFRGFLLPSLPIIAGAGEPVSFAEAGLLYAAGTPLFVSGIEISRCAGDAASLHHPGADTRGFQEIHHHTPSDAHAARRVSVSVRNLCVARSIALPPIQSEASASPAWRCVSAQKSVGSEEYSSDTILRVQYRSVHVGGKATDDALRNTRR